MGYESFALVLLGMVLGETNPPSFAQQHVPPARVQEW